VNTEEIVIGLFCRVDDEMRSVAKHPESLLWPSELMTIGLLFALKGIAKRAFHRWLSANCGHLFPRLPERTRLFRLMTRMTAHADRFLAPTTLIGFIDSYGIELTHPIRCGRSASQIGRKGISNHRWIAGGKLCLLLNSLGLVVSWDFARANTHDSAFHGLVKGVEGRMGVLGDSAFHSADGDPANLGICRRGQMNARMLIETVFSMMTRMFQSKRMAVRTWEPFAMQLGLLTALFNLLVQWHGLTPREDGFVPISIAEFVI
jgi:hypothetical protein